MSSWPATKLHNLINKYMLVQSGQTLVTQFKARQTEHFHWEWFNFPPFSSHVNDSKAIVFI